MSDASDGGLGETDRLMPRPSFGEDRDMNAWFELTYAQYLTIPRSILEAMPEVWQRQFVALLDELDRSFDWRPPSGRYWVQLKDDAGRYTRDPFMDYRYPNRKALEAVKK